MKSIEIILQGLSRTDGGFNRPHALDLLPLFWIHVVHDCTFFLQSFCNCGHQNMRCNSSEVLYTPKWPAKLWSWQDPRITTRRFSGTKMLSLYHNRPSLACRVVSKGEGIPTWFVTANYLKAQESFLKTRWYPEVWELLIHWIGSKVHRVLWSSTLACE